MMKMRPELLAPVSSLQTLKAAVKNGADAVYLGAGAYNARAFSDGPNIDDLPMWVTYAHEHGVFVYLTMNTLLFQEELGNALSLAKRAWLCGIDAAIVQDLGLVKTLAENLPELPLHASTQMNLFNADSIHFSQAAGISRIVLPRELSLDEIRSLTCRAENLGIQTEVFIHGALCMSFSGLCLFSAMESGGKRSGNRGTCAQPCRLRYHMTGHKNEGFGSGRYLSPKDRWGLLQLSDLCDIGVRSLKIEGRMKDAYYVGQVTRIYRECLDRIQNGESICPDRVQEMEHRLLFAFNRGGSFTEQYWKSADKNFFSGEYPGKYGVPIGTVKECQKTGGVLCVNRFINSHSNIPISRKDVLSIRRNDKEIASFPVGKFREAQNVLYTQGLHFSIFPKIKEEDSVFHMTAQALEKKTEKDKQNGIPVSLFVCQNGMEYCFRVSILSGMYKDLRVSGSLSGTWDDKPPYLSGDRIQEQLKKAGNTPFFVFHVSHTPERFPVPVSFLNTIRREALAALSGEIRKINSIRTQSVPEKPSFSSLLSKSEVTGPAKEEYHVRYYALSRIRGSLALEADSYSFSPSDITEKENLSRLRDLIQAEPGAKIWIWMPGAYKDRGERIKREAIQILRESFSDHFAGVFSSGYLSDVPALRILPEGNLLNSEAVAFSIEKMSPYGFSLSMELSKDKLLACIGSLPPKARRCFLDLPAYGLIPWMQTATSPAFAAEKEDIDYFNLKRLPEGKILKGLTDKKTQITLLLSEAPVILSPDILALCRNADQNFALTVRFLDESEKERKYIMDKTRHMAKIQ